MPPYSLDVSTHAGIAILGAWPTCCTAAPRGAEQDFARRRERETPALTRQQHHVQPPLGLADAVAQRRGRDAEVRRRPDQRPGLGQRRQHLQMGNVEPQHLLTNVEHNS